MGHCVVFLGKAFTQCLSLSTQEYKWVKEESRKPNEMLGGNLAMDWHPIPSASVCHYFTLLFQFFIKNEGNQMDTVSGKPNEMLGGTDFIYPPFILSGENWVSTPVGAMVL